MVTAAGEQALWFLTPGDAGEHISAQTVLSSRLRFHPHVASLALCFPLQQPPAGLGLQLQVVLPPCTRVLCSPLPDPARSASPTLREGPAGGLCPSCPSDSRAACLSLLDTHPTGLPQWLGHPQVGLQAAGTQGPEAPLGRWAGGVI